MVEWVETTAKSVKLAIKAALEELGLEDEEQAEIKVIQEAQGGFLGIGGQDAIVRVKPRPRSRNRKKPRKQGENARQSRPPRSPADDKRPSAAERPSSDAAAPSRDGVSREPDQQDVKIVKKFLEGLLDQFGLEGKVKVEIQGKIILANVTGEQTEALIGPKASVLQSVHELTKTVLQRKTAKRLRVRLDIAGYAARRQEALVIYAGKLAQQAVEERTEIMLEPMNAGDRKVVHDAIAEVEGVRSYSEGEEPRRSVVISPE